MTSEESSSIISTTLYGKNSARMIRGIERNLLLIIAIIGGLMVFSILDSVGALKLVQLYSENVHDSIVAIFSICAVLAMIPLLAYVIRSRRLLQRWECLFEENSLRTSFEIALAGSSNEDAVRAVAQSVDEIGEELQEYISKSGITPLWDNRLTRNYDFDVAIDTETTANQVGALNEAISRYGSIIVKTMAAGRLDNEAAKSFLDSLSKYAAETRHRIGLAIFIAEEFDASARAIAKEYSRKNAFPILLADRPVEMSLA